MPHQPSGYIHWFVNGLRVDYPQPDDPPKESLMSIFGFLSPQLFKLLSGPLYPKLSTCFEGAWVTQLVQLVTAGRLFLGHEGRVDL